MRRLVTRGHQQRLKNFSGRDFQDGQ
jgi:hypothetical protein